MVNTEALDNPDLMTSERNGYVTFILIDPAQCPIMGYEPDDIECYYQFGKEAADKFKAKSCRQNAFFFHKSCWEALTEHFRPGELDLNQGFEACRVVPSSQSRSRYCSRPFFFFVLLIT